MILFILLFIILAVLNIIFPSFAWYLRYGWMVKGDSEPSEAYLIMSRIGGVIMLVILVFYLMSGSVPL